MTIWPRSNPSNPLSAAWFFALAVLLMLPALLFSSFLSGWAVIGAMAGLALVSLLRCLATGRLIGHTPADWPLLLLLLMVVVGLRITADPQISQPLAYAFIANLALFWAVAAQRDASWLRWSGWLLLLAGLILGGIFLLGTHFSTAKLPFINRDIYTLLPSGLRPFWNPAGFNSNLSGGLLALFWAPVVVLAWLGRSWQERDVAKLVVVALSALLLLAQSRGALLGVAVALLVVTSLQSWRWRLFWLAALVSIVISIYSVGSNTVLEMTVEGSNVLSNPSLQSRQELWGRTIHLIRDFPLTGVGLGMVEPATQRLYPEFRVDLDDKHAHNIYLQAAAEMGLPGLVAHLWLYLILFYLLLRRALDRRAGYHRVLALGLLGSLITFLTHGFFEVITFAPRAAIVVWGLFGLMVAVATSSSGQDETGGSR